jgi:chemotaxis signal transduction protein
MVLDVSARQVALRIDEVLDVLHDSDVLAPVPLSVPGDAARILHGIIDTGTNIVHVIDVEKLVEA